MPTVFIPPQLKTLAGNATQVEVPAATLGEVIEALEQRFPGMRARLCEEGRLSPALQVSVDQVLTRDLAARAAPDSEVHFLPAIGGG